MDIVDVLVVGAGVVGLSVAAKLAAEGREVIVCEKEARAGQGVSSRNSGVIHAGLYYPPDSLKARLCVEGKRLLYAFCEKYHVAHKRIGKLVVATNDDEEIGLKRLAENAALNGVDDLAFLTAREVQKIEPELAVRSALFSPSTGIVDVHQLILALEGQLEAHATMVAYNAEITRITPSSGGLVVTTAGITESEVCAKYVINAAGLGAQTIATTVAGLSADHIPKLQMSRGNYFIKSGQSPFHRLVYPMPGEGGLGIHATLDLGGVLRFGPDVQPCDTENYVPDESRATVFAAAIARYYPNICEADLVPDYVGIRPQISLPGVFGDFQVSTESQHGIDGLINLFGIESPGLTASLAIAEHIAAFVGAAK